MENFSFSTTAGASQSTTRPKLAGNDIYEVKFEGCEIKDIQGVKDPTITYRQLVFKFANEDGVFEHTVWEPKSEDFTRKENEYTKDGKTNKITSPSNVESMMLFFKHVIDAVNPVVAQAIDKKEKTLTAPDWNSLRNLVIKILDPVKGTKTSIKLLKNKSGEATFPGYFTGLTKEGVAYVKNNFIGNKLAFSSYEVERMKNQSTSKPTEPSSFGDFSPAPLDQSGLDMNFDLNSI